MTQLEQQMIDELVVTQGFTNNLAANLNTKGVQSTSDEGLDTLVPKVLQIESGDEKTPYEKWQEGFGANWDSVIQNAPQAGNQPCLFIYNKVNEIKYANVSFNAVTYNPETDTYTPIVANANNKYVFSQSDYFTNSYDNNQYVCVIFKTSDIQWGSFNYNGTSIVYVNTKHCNLYNKDYWVNPLRRVVSGTPLLRGFDGYSPSVMNIGCCLEHLTLQEYPENLLISLNSGSQNDSFSVAGDTQIRIIKNIVDNKPITTTITVDSPYNLMAAVISDRKLSDWFYNDFFYNYYNGTTYGGGTYLVTKKTYKFKVNSNIQLTTTYQLNFLPDCVYLEGTFTENQSNDAGSAGLHRGFQSIFFTSLKNFPMWTVLDGATTGCLLPMTTTNTNQYTFGSFHFYSLNLESKYFCEFDENGIIEDPTKYFICNLPFEINTHANIYVRFGDLTFKDNYTAAQQDLIRAYLAHKKWNLSW